MITVRQTLPSSSIRISLREQGKEIAHAFLYLIRNDHHKKPYGLLENVLVEEAFRGKGFGKKIVQEVIQEAKRQGCYKLVCTSWNSKLEVHKFYLDLGFKEHGKEFRREF